MPSSMALGESSASRPQQQQSPPPRRHHGKRLRRCLGLLHGKELQSSRETTTSSSSIQNEHSSSMNKRRSVEDKSAAVSKEDASGDSSFSSTNVEEDEEDGDCEHARQQELLVLDSPTIMHSLSDTEVMGGAMSPATLNIRSGLQRRRSTTSVDSSQGSEKSYYSSKRKGVKYGRDGSVVCCRFCEILRARDEDFLYEDELVTVFRPLAPVVESHILVVPRCHIRNVNMLTKDHMMLLSRMREVATMLLQQMPPSSTSSNTHAAQEFSINNHTSSQSQDDAGYKFAFHTPPFNSIDHVHMHAFRRNEGSFGCFGAIKYRTETWWCRSFEQVITRLAVSSGKRHRRHHHHHRPRQQQQQNDFNSSSTSEEATSLSS